MFLQIYFGIFYFFYFLSILLFTRAHLSSGAKTLRPPQWTIIVKKIPNPVGEKRKRFAQEQESARKDVEHAFGVLQSRWGIVRYPANTWSTQKLWEVMTACVIMHNMIVEDERPERLYDQGF